MINWLPILCSLFLKRKFNTIIIDRSMHHFISTALLSKLFKTKSPCVFNRGLRGLRTPFGSKAGLGASICFQNKWQSSISYQSHPISRTWHGECLGDVCWVHEWTIALYWILVLNQAYESGRLLSVLTKWSRIHISRVCICNSSNI